MRWVSGMAMVGCLLAGCSSDAPADGDGRGGLNSGGNASGGSGQSGGDGDGDDTSDERFGNSDAGPVVLPDAAVNPMRDAGGGLAPDEEGDCGGTEVEPMVNMEIIPGNILLVYDNSGSMAQQWSEGSDEKWIDARRAVTDAIQPLADNVNVSAVFFPYPPEESSCNVPAYGAAPQIGFMPGADFLTAWDAFWATITAPEGATPLRSGLLVADQALASSTLSGTTNVVIVTDGEPNCSGGNARSDEPLTNLEPLVSAWSAMGISTYVVGLPGADEPAAVAILDGLASAGGTTAHIPASDPMTLQSELAAIIGESVTTNFDSCRIGLPSVPPDLDDVNLLVIEGGMQQSVARDLGTGGGWTLTPDGSEIVLQGVFCDLAKQGQYEKISVVFGCVEAPPLPPPEPMVPE